MNEEDDRRLRKPQHLSKTESDVLLYYVLESDDAKKNWKLRTQSFTTLKKDLRQSKDFGQSKNFHYFLDGYLPSIK